MKSGGFCCILDVFYEGLGLQIANAVIDKKGKFLSAAFFSNVLVIKPSIRIQIEEKLDPDPL